MRCLVTCFVVIRYNKQIGEVYSVLYLESTREQLKKLPKEICASFDATYPHGRLRHNSKHSASCAMSPKLGTILSAVALSKCQGNVIGNFKGTSAKMESTSLQYHVYGLTKENKIVTQCIVDGDTSHNTTKRKIVENLKIDHDIHTLPDLPHTRKNLPKKLYQKIQPEIDTKIKLIQCEMKEISNQYLPRKNKRGKYKYEDWHCLDVQRMKDLKEHLDGFKTIKRAITHVYCRKLTRQIFRYGIFDTEVNETPIKKDLFVCKGKIIKIINHYAPKDEFHSECDTSIFNCKTANKMASNTSSLMGDKKLPVGKWINQLILSSVFAKDCLSDGMLQGLLYKLTTSLNESWHNVVHSYGPKRIFFGRDTYRQIVYRATLQWNKPYLHMILANNYFGINLDESCLDLIHRLHKEKVKRKLKFQSHEHKLKMLQKKEGFKVDETYNKNDYKTGGFYDEFVCDDSDDDSKMTGN